MHQDVLELRSFYRSPLGGVARRLLTHRLRARWRHTAGQTVVGLGYAAPFLGPFRGEALRVGALMPGSQGAVAWPRDGPLHTVLVDEAHLPLPDHSVDRLLIVHGLETSENVRRLLREAWRVLTPEGRLLAIVPNRRGLWCRTERTPFGHGRPYSTAQLGRLLSESLFTVTDQSAGLFMPPIERALWLRPATAWERIGSRLWPAFAGVHLVEADKQVSGLIGTAAAQPSRLHVVVERPRAAQAADVGRDVDRQLGNGRLLRSAAPSSGRGRSLLLHALRHRRGGGDP